MKRRFNVEEESLKSANDHTHTQKLFFAIVWILPIILTPHNQKLPD